MDIPGLGKVSKDKKFGWLRSKPIAVPVLGRKMCRIIVEDYEEDTKKEEYHEAIANFLSIRRSVLKDAETHIFKYYKDSVGNWGPDDRKLPTIKAPGGVWRHIEFGNEPRVSRRAYGDKGIYVSLECECAWEAEHGLQIVFKNGLKVNKIGAYDGHVTNSDAFASRKLENVVYVS